MTRVALVTGSSGGIGRATVAHLRASGWIVLGVDRQASKEQGALQVDLVDEEAVRALMDRVSQEQGRLDALINNAADQLVKPLVETTGAEWSGIMASNVTSAFFCSRFAAPLLTESRGAIVNVGSVHSHATSAGMAAYVTSKGAISAMTRALCLELAPHVRVNAVLPGATDTPMLRAGLARSGMPEEDAFQRLAEKHPLGRIGLPEEIASAIEFLADGTRSSYVTGQSLIVDGGATSRLSTE